MLAKPALEPLIMSVLLAMQVALPMLRSALKLVQIIIMVILILFYVNLVIIVVSPAVDHLARNVFLAQVPISSSKINAIFNANMAIIKVYLTISVRLATTAVLLAMVLYQLTVRAVLVDSFILMVLV